MRPFLFGSLCGVLALVVAQSWLLGQTPAQAARARQAYVQAVGLHVEQKHTQALARLKDALALDPKNRVYLNYRTELEKLAAHDELDRHALQAPASVENSIESLAAYLVKPAASERDKARLIYRWITDRIAYDFEGLVSGKKDSRVEAVLQNRKAVCAGYARLFERLGKEAGLEVTIVVGRTKEARTPPGQEPSPTDHAWNAVKLDGDWQLIDATWGAGSIQNNKFKKRYREYFFLPPPEEFIFTHFPVESRWQLLPAPVALEEFKAWPRIPFMLFDLGFTAKDVGARLQSKGLTECVDVTDPAGPKIVVRTAPLERSLRNGSKYRVRVETAAFEDMVVIIAGKPSIMPRKGDGFETEFVARKGDLKVSGRLADAKSYESILRYKVD